MPRGRGFTLNRNEIRVGDVDEGDSRTRFFKRGQRGFWRLRRTFKSVDPYGNEVSEMLLRRTLKRGQLVLRFENRDIQ